MAFDHSACRPFDGSSVSDVADLVLCPERAGDRLQAVGSAREEDTRPAALHQAARRGLADAARAAGDDCDGQR
jgi:hypothetical protein